MPGVLSPVAVYACLWTCIQSCVKCGAGLYTPRSPVTETGDSELQQTHAQTRHENRSRRRAGCCRHRRSPPCPRGLPARAAPCRSLVMPPTARQPALRLGLPPSTHRPPLKSRYGACGPHPARPARQGSPCANRPCLPATSPLLACPACTDPRRSPMPSAAPPGGSRTGPPVRSFPSPESGARTVSPLRTSPRSSVCTRCGRPQRAEPGTATTPPAPRSRPVPTAARLRARPPRRTRQDEFDTTA